MILLMLAQIYRKLEMNGEFDPEFIEAAILADLKLGYWIEACGDPICGQKNTRCCI